jgi:3-isopropylmalate/(R)-2-methylmalate dehydratase large subunit
MRHYPPDDTTIDFVKGRAKRNLNYIKAIRMRNTPVLEFRTKDIEPQVAFPHLPKRPQCNDPEM